MPMKWIAAGVLSLALCTPLAAVAADGVASERLITMRLEGRLTVDAEGHVQEYHIRSKMPAPVKALLDKAIPNWRFEPVLVEGKPVLAESPMRILVAGLEDGDKVRLRIDNVLFRANTREEFAAEMAEWAANDVDIVPAKLPPPSYPHKLEDAGAEGIVLLALRLTADGRVAESWVMQSSLLNASGRSIDLERNRARFERSALAAAEAWRFKVKAKDDAALTPKAMTVSVPVEFTFRNVKEGSSFAGTWRREFRGPNRPVPWLAGDDGETIGVSDLGNGEMLTGTPRLRLRNRDEALGAP